MKSASVLAVVLLSLVAVAHFLRLLLQVDVVAGGVVIPMWVSVFGCVVPAGIAILLWRERDR